MATLSATGARGGGSSSAGQSLPSSSAFINDIMMLLDTENVQQLRREFSKQEEGLTLEEFVYVMKRFVNKAIARAKKRSGVLEQQRVRRQSSASSHRGSFSRHNSRRGSESSGRQLHQGGDASMAGASATIPTWMYDEAQLVSAIVELFSQIDINGDGEMEWDEFTSFIVDSGLAANEHDPNAIQDYRPCPSHVWTDTSVHASPIERTYYFPSTDCVGLVEQQSPSFKLYSGRDCVFRTELRPEQGNVLAGHHMADLNQYVVTSSSLGTSFYDDKTFRLLKSFHTPTSQHCMTSYRDTLYTAGVSGVVHAWDANKMEERHHLGGAGRDGRLLPESHQDMVMDLLTIPTLESLASASMDHTIRLWDSTSSRLRRVLSGHDKGVVALSYSTEYRFMVSVGFDYEGIVWNPYVKHMILKLHGHTSSLCGVEIIPDTPQIITGDTSGVFKVWDIRTFTCMQTFMMNDEGGSNGKEGHDPKTSSSSFGAGGGGKHVRMSSFASITKHKRIACGSRKMNLVEYEKLEHPELTDDSPVFAALFNETLLNFITASSDDIKIWTVDGKLLSRYRKISDVDLTCMCLDDRQRKFIVGDHAGVIRVFDYLSGALMKSFNYPGWSMGRAHRNEVRAICYVDEFKSFISSSWDKSVAVHDERFANRGVLLRRITNADRGELTCMDMSRNLSLIVTGSSTSMLHLWDYEFVRLEMTCDGESDGITAVTFLDPYPAFISADQKGNIEIWGTRPHAKLNGKCLYKFKNLVEGSTTQATPVTVMKVCVEWGRRVGFAKSGAASTPSDTLRAGGKVGISAGSASNGISSASSSSSSSKSGSIAEDGTDGRHVASVRLFTGDEKGEVRIWDLMPVISLLQERHDFFPLRKRYPCHNPQRTITYDASIELGEEAVADDSHGRGRRAKRDAESLSQMLSHVQSKVEEDNTFLTTVGGGMDGSRRAKANGQSSAISDGPMPFISPLAASITRMAMWSAHADSILSLQVIKEPPALITSGYDRLVRLWDQSGNSLGKFQRGHMNRTDWSFKANVEKFALNKRNEANNIIGRINRVVSAEEQKRKMGDFENANPFYEVSDDEDVDGIGASKTVPRYKLDIAKIKARAKATGEAESESQIDSVRLDIANLDETRARLISDYSNLSIFERNNRSAAGGGLADSLRRTPRMVPVGPQQAGKGYSATPRGRSSRLKTGSRSFKVGISRRRK